MIISNPMIVHCPKCGQKHQKMNLASGNTFGGIFWSDGSYFAPMLPDLPVFTRCAQCSQVFNSLKAESEEAVSFDEAQDLPEVEHLSREDIEEALDSGVFEGADDETLLRISLWQKMNRHPWKNEEPVPAPDDPGYRKNAEALIALLNGPDSEVLIRKAELYRNLGKFDQCIATLQKISDPLVKTYKNQLEKACRSQKSGTICIS